MKTIRDPDRHETPFAVVAAPILDHHDGAFEDKRGKGKVEATLLEIGVTLLRIPLESHSLVYICIYILSSLAVDPANLGRSAD